MSLFSQPIAEERPEEGREPVVSKSFKTGSRCGFNEIDARTVRL